MIEAAHDHLISDRSLRIREAWKRVRASDRVRQMFDGERLAVVASLAATAGSASGKEQMRLRIADETEESLDGSASPDAVRFRLVTESTGQQGRWKIVADGLVIEEGFGPLEPQRGGTTLGV
jgi:hypothetical protein